MDSILRFATGHSSSVESFARDVYIKSNLTIELNRVLKQLVAENVAHAEGGDNHQILIETPTVSLLCDILEAILLHGLKEKLSTRVSNVFGSGSQRQHKNVFSLDFWPIVSILCHTAETRSLKQLRSISTDIGRCRAWLRSALNESLFRSYFDSLICDSSLLNGFYRSSAYLRDTQHTEMMRQFLIDLEKYIFHLTVDNVDLNCWSDSTLNFLGINISSNCDDSLVVTALDAIHLISEDKSIKESVDRSTRRSISSDRSKSSGSDKGEVVATTDNVSSSSNKAVDIVLKVEEVGGDDELRGKLTDGESANISEEGHSDSFNVDGDSIQSDFEHDNEKENHSSCTGNSLSVKSGWSTQPVVNDESYDAILESYSSRAVLSSTPDINDVRLSIASGVNPLGNATNLHYSSSLSSSAENDFEIIPKNVVLNNSDADNQRFFEQLSKIAQEHGLDEQDYKCHLCHRPIGMIYGKSRLCHIDGHLYCTECHTEAEAIIPAQIIYNWNFKKYAVSSHNKKRLLTIESEPIFDIKLLSPLLYSVIDQMAEVLDLRTQLFFLHAYLFTCQEGVALKMRKMVWPREHLFEHIHLYSINDLLQVCHGTLAPTLRQTIAFARKHVFSCALCKLKGYYCEICNGSEILYPFDTETTRRCEGCKSVFHRICFEEKYDKHSCPKCLRQAKKRSQQQVI